MPNLNEISLEEIEKKLSGLTVSQGGLPGWMFDEYFSPYVKLLQERLRIIGAKLVFVEDK